jgi:hypothetical protein
MYLLLAQSFRSKKSNEDSEPLRYRPVEDSRILQPFPVSFGRDYQNNEF